MKFLVPNYSCLQNPWLGGYRLQIPVLSVLCPQLNLLNPPNKIPGYATGLRHRTVFGTQFADSKEAELHIHEQPAAQNHAGRTRYVHGISISANNCMRIPSTCLDPAESAFVWREITLSVEQGHMTQSAHGHPLWCICCISQLIHIR